MPTHVYANNNEVASKAADGKSIAAFPDVCFSPPAPPVGPMPLPYPNTGEVKDTDSGTAKVFVKDKMSGMGDDSHMTKSMGDEPATKNFNKGIISSALQGKCYFKLWSMDVSMEGKGVPRHLDMVTHNHASECGDVGGAHTDGASQSNFQDSGSKKDKKLIEIVSLDLLRPSRNSNTIQYVGSCLNEDEVYTNLKDTDLVTDDYLVQYVNLASQKLTRNVMLPNIAKYISNGTPRMLPSSSQVGNQISIRVRFNCKGKHSFVLAMSKRGVRYSQQEINLNQQQHPEILCSMNNESVKFGKWVNFTTNDDGYIVIPIKIDMSHAKYVFSVKYKKTTKKLELESWRKIFIRTFVLDSFSPADLQCISDSVKKTITFYNQYGIDIEHLCQIRYPENSIYMERVFRNGRFQNGMMLNGSSNQSTTGFFQSINTIINAESANNMHNAYSIDVFFVYYLYTISVVTERFDSVHLRSDGRIEINLRNGHFVNPNITSISPIIKIILLVGGNMYIFEFCNNIPISFEESNAQLMLEYQLIDDTKIELMPNALLATELGQNNNFKVFLSFYNVNLSAGFSFSKSWRAVFVSLYPLAIGSFSHAVGVNLNNRTQWLPSIIAHEIAHRIDIVPENFNNNTGTIVLEKSSTSDTNSPEHCVNSTCLMYREVNEVQTSTNSMKPVCTNCERDLEKVDLRIDLPSNLQV